MNYGFIQLPGNPANNSITVGCVIRNPEAFIRHISLLMFDVIDVKPEGFIMYKSINASGFLITHLLLWNYLPGYPVTI